MKRLVIAALALVAVFTVAGSALAASGSGSSVIFNSTDPNGPPSNLPSYGPEAYSFKTIGDEINLAGTARSLNSVTVTLSSWACQTGTWQNQTCQTDTGATFAQPITLTIFDGQHNQLASSTQTFAVPYRPSASPKCLSGDPSRPGGWYQPSSKTCKNGLADDVTFNFSHVTLPRTGTVKYEISYNTNTHGPTPSGVASPADSLNVAVTAAPSVGKSTDENIWIDGIANSGFGSYAPAVQFKAGNAS